eukprot:CAMPEP_0184871268 /NCGR_PEP_ID=MMETSP0580-20130426/40566_1 /TAXON_ID=1118495 /ORGANISM="Dactyliosolen fragilissimus" /LENGTH=327 /DNA_ID=CAMNT_0027373893 /DNA_START=92 /DNA_END=1072 /DNA_ORIENTATION=+
MSPMEQKEWDAPLIALTQKSGGDLRRLFFAFFSFLNRRTDFYMIPNDLDIKEGVPQNMGFKNGDAEKMLIAAFRQFPLRKMPRMCSSNDEQKKNGKDTSRSASCQNSKTDCSEIKDLDYFEKSCDQNNCKGEKIENINKPSNSKQGMKEICTPGEKINKSDETVNRYTEDGKQVPVGNGGSRGNSKWTQTLNEVSIALPLPDKIRSRDLDVTLKSTHISVKLKDRSQILLEGNLTEKIRTAESTWSLEGGVLLITMEKIVHTWWKCILLGDEEIDTSLVDSTRNISEYDDATQGMIRKILFDQRQARLGLPSSDDILRKDLGSTLSS